MTPEILALEMRRKISHAHTAKVTIFSAEELKKRLAEIDEPDHAGIQENLLMYANKKYSAPTLEMVIRMACGPKDVSNAILIQYVEALSGESTVARQLKEKLLNIESVVEGPVI